MRNIFKGKNLIIILVICLIALILISRYRSHNNNIATTQIGNITKEELYEKMKTTAGASSLQKLIMLKVLTEKYGDKETDNQVNKKFEEQKEQYGDKFPGLFKNSNYTEKSYKETIRMNLLIEAAVTAETKLTDEDYKIAWESFVPKLTAQHILVADETTAKDIIAKINAGEDFDTLAKENSLDTGSKKDGGKLPEFDHNTPYDPVFIKAAAKLKDGEVSQEPVKDSKGYHIIKIIKNPGKGKMKDHTKELEKIAIKKRLADGAYVQSIVSKIIKETKLNIKDDYLKEEMGDFLKQADSTKSKATDSSKKESSSDSK
ncbi:peptidylprolyl isomerase [Carnobacterium maltaromaticum]|nr:peptidylprolyl isomerase [Carnobacterium maltaromaticum]PLS34991.1 peptidylprolyl isomerase [Carnobacterium maltaromaticum]PLS35404.1 peptidylprolyl isomerase [Carnobacterium maltaromaticum]PLS41958.1 peptidylprolyl isomerase [Carnobacterium maltaromaticum]PLS44793.1 peptidylprolyl isomerase [Carnobacterium maltaromaticum]